MIRPILIMSLLLFLMSCSEKKDKPFEVPANYQSWKKPVSEILDYPVPGHGSKARVIYGNDLAFQAKLIKDSNEYERYIFQNGSIIIKEIYANKNDVNQKKPLELTIMVKDSEHSKNQDGWLYYVVQENNPSTLIETQKCVRCHEGANDTHPYFDKNTQGIYRDYVYAPFFK